MDDRIWDHSSFTKNRDRLIEAKVARKLLRRIGRRARREGLLSSEHFSVDGTLIEAWSAVKSMRRRDGKDDPPAPGRNPHVDCHGERRTNETHLAPHEPEAKLFRKGKGQAAKLYYMGHVLMEHRQGLPIDAEVTEAKGYAERKTAIRLLKRNAPRPAARWPADKAYDTRQFVAELPGAGRHPACGTEHQRATAARPSMHVRPATAATGPASVSASASRKPSVGARTQDRMRKMRVRGNRRRSRFMTPLTVGCYRLLRVAKLLFP